MPNPCGHSTLWGDGTADTCYLCRPSLLLPGEPGYLTNQEEPEDARAAA